MKLWFVALPDVWETECVVRAETIEDAFKIYRETHGKYLLESEKLEAGELVVDGEPGVIETDITSFYTVEK